MIILLMLLGAFLVYSLIRYVYKKMWNKNLTNKLSFDKDHVVCNDTVNLVEEVVNAKNLPLPYIYVKFLLDKSFAFTDGQENSVISDFTYRNDVFSLMMYQKITRKIPLICTRRGVYSINKTEIVCNGAFLNDICVMTTEQNAFITVYPHTINTDILDVLFQKLMGVVEYNKRLYQDPFMFRGIRDYVNTDTMNTINWKATAKTGELKVNEFNQSVCQEVCILLDLDSDGMMRFEEVLEEEISLAAGLSERLIENGIEVSVVSNGKDYYTGKDLMVEAGCGLLHINAINTALATIDLSKNMIDFPDYIFNLIKLNENKIYVLISCDKSKKLQQAFNMLCRNKDKGLWILPYRKGYSTELDCIGMQPIEWEVTVNGR